jgi:hypothetical protein
LASRLTAARRKLFLQAYVACGTIIGAARASGVSDTLHFDWMKDPEYAAAFAEAEKQAIAHLETELFNRVYEGTEEPVIYQGELCYQKDAKGKLTNKPLTIRRKSDTLLIFALKGKKPDVYRDNFKGEITHTGVMAVSQGPDLSKLSDDQWSHVKAILGPALDGPAMEGIREDPDPGSDSGGGPEESEK